MLPLSERLLQANRQLSPLAVPYEGRLGRRLPENPDGTRFPFQRDRDRIIHSTAFRRLQGKTQVFVAGEGDHFRTRLTHTMEVAQIGRDIARALALNEDLTECIALAHDLGHPPFGHAGEEALDRWMKEFGGRFEHNEQSFRVITLLEKHSTLHSGLNLNREVEEGLLKHSAAHPVEGHALEPTFEAQIANRSDEIAYIAHDCDDGLLAGLISMDDLLRIPLAQAAQERRRERGTFIRSSLIHLMTLDLLTYSASLLESSRPEDRKITFSPSMLESVRELRSFLMQHLYPHPRVALKTDEGKQIVGLLCRQYLDHPTDKILSIRERTGSTLHEAVKDYVAGMTDNFSWLQAAEYGLLPVILLDERS